MLIKIVLDIKLRKKEKEKKLTKEEQQRQNQLEGEAFETATMDLINMMTSCVIAERQKGAGTDFVVVCDRKDVMGIEAKKSNLKETEAGSTRYSRFNLHEKVYPKTCYSFGVADRDNKSLTVDFLKADEPDAFISQYKGTRPKYPIKEMWKLKEDENNRCFIDIPTMRLPLSFLMDRVKK